MKKKTSKNNVFFVILSSEISILCVIKGDYKVIGFTLILQCKQKQSPYLAIYLLFFDFMKQVHIVATSILLASK